MKCRFPRFQADMPIGRVTQDHSLNTAPQYKGHLRDHLLHSRRKTVHQKTKSKRWQKINEGWLAEVDMRKSSIKGDDVATIFLILLLFVSVEMREMERWRLPESSFHYLEIIQFVCRFTEGSLFCRSFVVSDPDRTYFWTRGFPQQHVRWCANIPWMFMLHIILDGNVSVKLAKYFWLALILPAEFNSSVCEQQRLSKYLSKHPWRHIFAPWG